MRLDMRNGNVDSRAFQFIGCQKSAHRKQFTRIGRDYRVGTTEWLQNVSVVQNSAFQLSIDFKRIGLGSVNEVSDFDTEALKKHFAVLQDQIVSAARIDRR